jgi:hypothetical protein
MTTADYSAFVEMFGELASLFRFYGTDEQRAAALSAYFQTLQSYPLDRVRRGYEQLKVTATKWPVPAQWIAAMPRGDSALAPMDWRQVKASDEAEKLFYEGPLCHCVECERAHVTHLPLRYVPVLNSDGEVIPLQHPNRSQPVLRGEWIHGQRLRSWYRAKAEFYQKLESLKPGVRAAIETAAAKG